MNLRASPKKRRCGCRDPPPSRFYIHENPLNGGPPFKWFISQKMRRERAGGSLLIGPAWILYGGRRQRFSDKGHKLVKKKLTKEQRRLEKVLASYLARNSSEHQAAEAAKLRRQGGSLSAYERKSVCRLGTGYLIHWKASEWVF